MKLNQTRLIVLILCFCTYLPSFNAKATSPKPAKSQEKGQCKTQNVKEAYLTVGSKELAPTDEDGLEYKVKIEDLGNGFLLLENEDGMGFQVALFKEDRASKVLVMVSEGGSEQTVFTFKCGSKEWEKYTDDVVQVFSAKRSLPLYERAKLIGVKVEGRPLMKDDLEEWGELVHIELPRKGRVIQLKVAIDDKAVFGKSLGTIQFKSGKFVLDSARP